MQITILKRQGITQFVDVVFFIMESDYVVAAERSVATLNQLTLEGLSKRLRDHVS